MEFKGWIPDVVSGNLERDGNAVFDRGLLVNFYSRIKVKQLKYSEIYIIIDQNTLKSDVRMPVFEKIYSNLEGIPSYLMRAEGSA